MTTDLHDEGIQPLTPPPEAMPERPERNLLSFILLVFLAIVALTVAVLFFTQLPFPPGPAS